VTAYYVIYWNKLLGELTWVYDMLVIGNGLLTMRSTMNYVILF